MGEWYILQTVSGKEEEAAALMRKKTPERYWEACRVLNKRRLFRLGGRFYVQEAVLFPGYVFVKTETPEELSAFLKRSPDFPQPIALDDSEKMIPIKAEDLAFLKNVCGEELNQIMGISGLRVNEEREILDVSGALERYRDQIIKINMHKRFVLVEVELFDRVQPICFSFKLAEDELLRKTA